MILQAGERCSTSLPSRRSLVRIEEKTMSVRWGVPGACVLAVLLLLPATAAAEEKENPILTFVKSKVKDPDKTFTLIIALKVKEGEGKKLEEAFAKAARATRKEKGCITYDLNYDAGDASRYLVYERWKSVDALKAHLETEHIKALLAALPELLAGTPEPRVLIPAAE
jgi:quinol monooxygenase YgiN